MSELEMAVAQAFKLRGKSRLNRTEFTFVLAYELKWFTPEESAEVLDAALKKGLLKEEGGKLLPTFNVKLVDVPKDFKPDMGILKEKNLFDQVLDLLAAAGIDRTTALVMIGNMQKEYGDLVTPEAAALVIARGKGLDVRSLIDNAYSQLVGHKT